MERINEDAHAGDLQDTAAALTEPDTALRLFGKPEVHGKRRMGVALARGATLDAARATARRMVETLSAGVQLQGT